MCQRTPLTHPDPRAIVQFTADTADAAEHVGRALEGLTARVELVEADERPATYNLPEVLQQVAITVFVSGISTGFFKAMGEDTWRRVRDALTQHAPRGRGVAIRGIPIDGQPVTLVFPGDALSQEELDRGFQAAATVAQFQGRDGQQQPIVLRWTPANGMWTPV